MLPSAPKLSSVSSLASRGAIFAALLAAGSQSRIAEAQPMQSGGPRVELVTLEPPACDSGNQFADTVVRRGRAPNGNAFNATQLRCMGEQARSLPDAARSALPTADLACLPYSVLGSLSGQDRERWNDYPRNLNDAQVAALTPSQTSCLAPLQIARFTTEQWNLLSDDARAVMVVPEERGGIAPERVASIVASRARSATYLLNLLDHFNTQGNYWNAARVAALGVRLPNARLEQAEALAYNFGQTVLRIARIHVVNTSASLVPDQSNIISNLFPVADRQRYDRLPVNATLTLPTGAGAPHTMGLAEFNELFELTRASAAQLTELLRDPRNHPNIARVQTEIRNIVAVLDALKEKMITVREQHTNWGIIAPSRDNVAVRTVPPVVPSSRIEEHTVVPTSFWPLVAGAGAGLVVAGVGLGLNVSGHADADAAINECSVQTTAMGRCNPALLTGARDSFNQANTGTALAVIGGLVSVGLAIPAIINRPNTVRTTVPAATAPVGPTPHPRRTDNQSESANGATYSVGSYPLPGGAMVTFGATL